MNKRRPGQLWEVACEEAGTRAVGAYYLILEQSLDTWTVLHGGEIKEWPEAQLEGDTLLSDSKSRKNR